MAPASAACHSHRCRLRPPDNVGLIPRPGTSTHNPESNSSSMRTLLILIALTRSAVACSCGSEPFGPICQRIGELKVLFVGKAIARNDLHEAGIRVGTWYKFTVDEVFKGLQPNVREVIVDPGSGTSCQMSFTIGSRHLVFSYAETLAGLPNNSLSLIHI